jgi:hypothetical protein
MKKAIRNCIDLGLFYVARAWKARTWKAHG